VHRSWIISCDEGRQPFPSHLLATDSLLVATNSTAFFHHQNPKVLATQRHPTDRASQLIPIFYPFWSKSGGYGKKIELPVTLRVTLALANSLATLRIQSW